MTTEFARKEFERIEKQLWRVERIVAIIPHMAAAFAYERSRLTALMQRLT
jgi:hypothetical protein